MSDGPQHYLSAGEIPTLNPDLLYEACPDCGGVRGRFDWIRHIWDRMLRRGLGGCLTCFDEGLVPHRCPADELHHGP